MNVYVESNFVLELALVQEQHASCEEIVRLAAAGRARLVIPAYSLAEPYETLVRRRKQRKQLKAHLDQELKEHTCKLIPRCDDGREYAQGAAVRRERD